jgi:hypothetical protein
VKSKKQIFQSPSEVYSFINKVIQALHEKGFDAQPLEEIQSTAYTTGSEWLDELRVAIKKVQQQKINDHDIKEALNLLMRHVHSLWPD